MLAAGSRLGHCEIAAAPGDTEEAFHWLDAAYGARHGFGTWLRTEPLFVSLRSAPRCAALVRRTGLPLPKVQGKSAVDR